MLIVKITLMHGPVCTGEGDSFFCLLIIVVNGGCLLLKVKNG